MIGEPTGGDDEGQEWPRPPAALDVDRGEVHVWRVPLCLPAELLPWAEGRLDREERAQASRFHFAADRARFAVGRAIQREILARYLRLSPKDVRYRTNQFGKLAVAGAGASRDLHFNFSNSAGLGLLAIATGRAVGIDIERLRPISDAMLLASHCFSAAECAVLGSVHPAERDMMFLRCWTQKEAYIKALGEGLSLPLDSFDVAFAPGEAARLLDRRSSPSETARWKMQTLAPADGYVAALAVEGHDWSRRQFGWSPDVSRRFITG